MSQEENKQEGAFRLIYNFLDEMVDGLEKFAAAPRARVVNQKPYMTFFFEALPDYDKFIRKWTGNVSEKPKENSSVLIMGYRGEIYGDAAYDPLIHVWAQHNHRIAIPYNMKNDYAGLQLEGGRVENGRLVDIDEAMLHGILDMTTRLLQNIRENGIKECVRKAEDINAL